MIDEFKKIFSKSKNKVNEIIAILVALGILGPIVSYVLPQVGGILTRKNTEIKEARTEIASQQGKPEKLYLTKPLETLVRHGESLAHQDLNGASLEPGIKLNKATLTQTKLNRAKLIRAKLDSANMSGAEFVSAKLTKADMSNANLGNAHLQKAELGLATLTNALLPNADLRAVDLGDAELKGAILSNADIGCLDGICTNFKGAKDITIEQIQSSKNWRKACYDEDFRNKLKLPTAPRNQKCAGEDL
jgi:uncharacterized protein YjbI with pentapeptide repeats